MPVEIGICIRTYMSLCKSHYRKRIDFENGFRVDFLQEQSETGCGQQCNHEKHSNYRNAVIRRGRKVHQSCWRLSKETWVGILYETLPVILERLVAQGYSN